MLTDLSPNRPELSAEARVLLGPAAAFRELAQGPGGGGAWVLVRRPLLLAFVIGCLVSLQASGRLSARLIADGAVSFAFVPLFAMAALAAVYRLSPRTISFARAVDLFFAATAPWLLWMAGLVQPDRWRGGSGGRDRVRSATANTVGRSFFSSCV